MIKFNKFYNQFNILSSLLIIASLILLIFKGKDYLQKKVVGKKDIKKWGGKLILIDYLEGLSTTNILKRIRDAT